MLFWIITNCASTLLMVLSNLSNLSNLSMFEKVLNWGVMFGGVRDFLYLGLLGDKVFALGKAKINKFILCFALVFVPLPILDYAERKGKPIKIIKI